MTSSARGTVRRTSQAKKAGSARAATAQSTPAKTARKTRRSATDRVIATDLAPAVAIALLEKTDRSPGDPAPALECLVAGAGPSEQAGNVRVQLMFENGAVLPVEMSEAAGAALSKGLAEELPKKAKKPKKQG